MGKGHGKLCRVFCFDLTLQTVDGHADFLGKAAIFLAIRGLFVAYQIILIRTRQVQILRILSRGGCRQLTAIAGVSAGNGGIVIESLFNRDLLASVQIDIRSIAAEFCILQDNTAALQIDTLSAIFKCSTNNFRTCRILSTAQILIFQRTSILSINRCIRNVHFSIIHNCICRICSCKSATCNRHLTVFPVANCRLCTRPVRVGVASIATTEATTFNCYNTTCATESHTILRYHFRLPLNGHLSASVIIDCRTIDTFVASSVNNHRSRTVCYCKVILAFRSNISQRHLTLTVPKRFLVKCSIASTIDNGTSSSCSVSPCCHKTTVALARSDVIVSIIIDCYATCRFHTNQIGKAPALIMVTVKSISNISDDIDCYAFSSDFDREVIISSHLIGCIIFRNGVHTTGEVIWNQCSLARINVLLRKCRHCPRRQECQHHTERQ